MGLGSSIKRLLGIKEEPGYNAYDPPLVVIRGGQRLQGPDSDYWSEAKKKWDKRMEWERQRRSKYGGF